MKRLLSIALIASLLSSSASAAIFNNSGVPVTISDGNSTGIENTINVTGLGASVQSFTLTLNISGGRNGDLYAYLSHDNATAILLNRVGSGAVAGGYNNTGFQATFQDGSPDIHTYQAGSHSFNGSGQLTGTWGADGRAESPFSVTAASTRTSNPFSVFTGGSANGNWTLFIADVNGNGSEATLNSWNLDITAVPEPVNLAFGIFGGFVAVVQGVRYWKKK